MGNYFRNVNVGAERLEDRFRNQRRDRTVEDKSRRKTLPGTAGPLDADRVHVEAMLRGNYVGRTDRRGFGRNGRKVTALAKAAVQRVLGQGERAERHDTRAHLLPLFQRGLKLGRIGFDKREVAGPARA